MRPCVKWDFLEDGAILNGYLSDTTNDLSVNNHLSAGLMQRCEDCGRGPTDFLADADGPQIRQTNTFADADHPRI